MNNALYVNQGNHCGTGISCNIDKRRCKQRRHFLHRDARASLHLQAKRAMRMRDATSTLP
jgi:hypothetical protein